MEWQVPALGLGTWFLGENKSAREREQESLRAGVAAGMTLIDTAGNVWKWKSGKSYKRGHFCKKRDDLFLVSKVLQTMRESTAWSGR